MGKSNLPSSPVENEIIELHKDDKYRNLQATITAVEDVYRNATPEQKAIIEYRYWEKDLLIYEWEDIAHELTKRREDDKVISQHSAIRMRNQIMRDVAKGLDGYTSTSRNLEYSELRVVNRVFLYRS